MMTFYAVTKDGRWLVDDGIGNYYHKRIFPDGQQLWPTKMAAENRARVTGGKVVAFVEMHPDQILVEPTVSSLLGDACSPPLFNCDSEATFPCPNCDHPTHYPVVAKQWHIDRMHQIVEAADKWLGDKGGTRRMIADLRKKLAEALKNYPNGVN